MRRSIGSRRSSWSTCPSARSSSTNGSPSTTRVEDVSVRSNSWNRSPTDQDRPGRATRVDHGRPGSERKPAPRATSPTLCGTLAAIRGPRQRTRIADQGAGGRSVLERAPYNAFCIVRCMDSRGLIPSEANPLSPGATACKGPRGRSPHGHLVAGGGALRDVGRDAAVCSKEPAEYLERHRGRRSVVADWIVGVGPERCRSGAGEGQGGFVDRDAGLQSGSDAATVATPTKADVPSIAGCPVPS